MKEKKQEKSKAPISREILLRRNPIPFGDVRKYYYAGMIGTVVLLAVCFYISFAAIVLRTDSCVQIPNGIIAVLLLCALLSVVGHYSRTLAGYGLSVVMCLVIVLVLQLYNGGIMLKSNLLDYGEAVREGIKGTDFWILLAKALAVVHMLLSVVFINSTLKVKEEPLVNGMNKKLLEFREWFAKKDAVTSLGWRPTEFWMTCACVILWMLVAQANPFETNKYDYMAMFFVLLGMALVFLGKAYVGALCLMEGFLTCCTMYQLRFGWSIPTVGAYAGTWLSLLFLVLEANRRRAFMKENEWSFRLGRCFKVQISVFSSKEKEGRKQLVLRTICIIITTTIALFMFPVHEFLSGFSGSYMNQQKDNLPLFFFLPLVMLVCVWGGTALGYLSAGVVALLLYDAICEVSSKGTELFLFNSIEQHGRIGDTLTNRANEYIPLIESLSLLCFVICVITSVCLARRRYERSQEAMDN